MTDYKKLAEEIISIHINCGTGTASRQFLIADIAQALEQAVIEDRKRRLKWPREAESTKAMETHLKEVQANDSPWPHYLFWKAGIEWLKSQVKWEEK